MREGNSDKRVKQCRNCAWRNIVNPTPMSGVRESRVLTILISTGNNEQITAAALPAPWNNGTASRTLSRTLNGRWWLSPWSTSNRVNPRTDSVRTFRDVSFPPKVYDRAHHSVFSLALYFPRNGNPTSRDRRKIFSPGRRLCPDSTSTTSGLMHNDLAVTWRTQCNSNISVLYLSRAMRGFGEESNFQENCIKINSTTCKIRYSSNTSDKTLQLASILIHNVSICFHIPYYYINITINYSHSQLFFFY